MKISVFTIAWNEEFILPYFLRHYTEFADVYVLDDHSTDNTPQIVENDPRATLIEYPYQRALNEEDHSKAFVEAYKEHAKDADWVICVDTDEFIYHPYLEAVLTGVGSRAIVKPEGYMMISEKPPTTDSQIYDEIKTGVRMSQYDKPVILDPRLEVKFGDGRHSIEADVKPMNWGVKLLHYKYLGRDYYEQRSKLVYPRTDMPSDKMREYRLKRGLKWFDDHINTKEVVI